MPLSRCVTSCTGLAETSLQSILRGGSGQRGNFEPKQTKVGASLVTDGQPSCPPWETRDRGQV